MTTLAERPELTASAPSGAPDSPPAVPTPVAAAGGRRLAVMGGVIFLLGVVVLSFVGYLFFFTNLQETRTQDNLYSNFRGRLLNATAPLENIKPGDAVAIMTIPRLHVRQVVVEGTTSSDLMLGPGHRRDTPLPGEAGISVIYCRRATFGAPCHAVPDLRPGDIIRVATGQAADIVYRVTSQRNSHGRVPSYNEVVNQLFLVTSTPSMHPSDSLIVTADLEGTPQPNSAEVLPSITPSERPLTGDTGYAVSLLLWGQLLLLVLGAATYAFYRWGRMVTYLAATPAVLACTWSIFENLARLLPNTF